MRKPLFILWALLCLAIATTMPAAGAMPNYRKRQMWRAQRTIISQTIRLQIKKAHGEDRRKSAWFYLAYLPCLIPILIIAGIIYAIKTKEPTDEARPTPTKKFIVSHRPKYTWQKIVRVLGLVRGNTIRARHVGKDIVAGLRNVVGGEVTNMPNYYLKAANKHWIVCWSRQKASEPTLSLACSLRPSVIMGITAEMMAYGTAVIVEE